MLSCSLCHKKTESDNVKLFNVPKDVNRRRKWGKMCSKTLGPNARICEDHFSSEDIVKKAHKVVLTPKALPIAIQSESTFSQNFENLDVKDHLLDTSIESSEKFKYDCRCCRDPSTNFIKLDSFIKISDGIQKTYKDLYHEILKLNLSKYQENMMPQQICNKCSTELKKAYKFSQMACKVSQEYLDIINQTNSQEDIKNVEQLRESLIEISEATTEEIKVEPLSIECNIEIKEEKLDSDKEEPSQDERNYAQKCTELSTNTSNTLDATHEEYQIDVDCNSDSEDDVSTEDPILEDDFDKDLSKAPIAISCDICHKICKDKVALRTHKHYSHMPEDKKRPCPLCSFKSSRLSNLKVHIGVVHGADKVTEFFKPADENCLKFPCSLCQQSFRRKDTLQKHIKRIHKNPQPKEPRPKTNIPKEKESFLCTYCGGSFLSKNGLQRHVVIHTGERPFPCEICQKTFKSLQDLNMHRVIHSDAKPHQCLQCGKAFKRSDKLKIHMRVHSELRPYKCRECEKTFKYPNVLSTHMLIHTGQNPFHCKTCGESFSLRSSLSTHCLRNGHMK